jgi:hypothetical protein
LQNDRLAEARPAEQAGLAAPRQRREQVHDLDAGDEHFRLGRQLGELRRLAVDRAVLLGVDRLASVDRLTQQVEDAAQRLHADGHLQRLAGVGHGHAADQAVGRAEGDAADAVAAEVLLHLARQADLHVPLRGRLDLQGVVNLGEAALLELHVEGGADDLHDLAGLVRGRRHLSALSGELRVIRDQKT